MCILKMMKWISVFTHVDGWIDHSEGDSCMSIVFAAQVLEEDKEHGPLVAICHVLQEEISLDTTGWTRRYVDTHTPSLNVSKKSVS